MPRKYRILVVSSKFYPEYSGSGLRAHRTYKRLKKKYRIDFDVVSSSLQYTGYKKYMYGELFIYRISGLLKVWGFSGILRKIVIWINLPFEIFFAWVFIRQRIKNYDLIHTFGDSWTVGFLTWYFSKKKKPVIRELCNESPSPFFPKRFARFMKPIFLNNNKSKIVAISPKLEVMAKKFDVQSVWQRPNPVNAIEYSLSNKSNKYTLRKKLTKFTDTDVILLNIAMFWRNKNQRFLIKLLSSLEDKYKLILIGVVKEERENYYQQVISDIKKFSLEDRVEIIPNFVKNPYDYMSLADVYLFPSKHEGLGTTILESQACGTPVLSNQLPGITDTWIKNGSGGYSCKLEPELWAEKILETLSIPEEILNKNSDYILSKSNSDLIDTGYMDIFEKLVN